VIHEEFRRKALEYLNKNIAIDTDRVIAELIQSYVVQENQLLDRIKQLEANQTSSHGNVDEMVKAFIQDTQFRLENEKYALMAKCAALEEELGY
jgi:hypothetical protein